MVVLNCRLSTSLLKTILQLHVKTSRRKMARVPSRHYALVRGPHPPKRYHKVYVNAAQAVEDIESGSHILIGGYGLCGLPDNLLEELAKAGHLKNLTVVCADAGTEDSALSLMLKAGQVKRVVTSSVRSNHLLEEMFLGGLVEVKMMPQGTLATKLRAGGSGIPAFYTPVGAGTIVEHGGLPLKYFEGGGTVEVQDHSRETRTFHGDSYVLEFALKGHYALVRAWRADEAGNLCFKKTTRNFNVTMCKAARIVVAEVDEILPKGGIEAEAIHVPGVYVDRLVCREKRAPKVETVHFRRPETVVSLLCCTPAAKQREKIARRAVMEIRKGMCVNLGPGIPMSMFEFIPPELRVFLHSVSGVIGMGPYPDSRQQVDPDLINGCKEPVTEKDGICYMSSDEAFAMVIGGHVDMIIIDALEVSQYGDVANWTSSPDASKPQLRDMGSAMDLVAARRENARVVVTMTHCDPSGRNKIVKSCSMPTTGLKCIDLIITEMGVFKVHPEEGLTLLEKSNDVTVEELVANTSCEFEHAETIKPMMQLRPLPDSDDR